MCNKPMMRLCFVLSMTYDSVAQTEKTDKTEKTEKKTDKKDK